MSASSPARKKVLSPISERKIREKAAKKPDFPIAEWAAQSCKSSPCFSNYGGFLTIAMMRKTYT